MAMLHPPSTSVLEDRSSVYTATSVSELHAALAALSVREASVTSSLDTLISTQNDLSRELNRLDLLRARLGPQVVNTRAISNGMLSEAAATASTISSAVNRLDLEQGNVKATLDVVEQVAELKACVLGVHGSMGAPQDWETAAGYLHRASKIPREVMESAFAEEIVPTAEVPDAPAVTLFNASEALCGLFLREFERAAAAGDGAKVTRFFKLFPLVGRSDTGLDAYGRYVCQGVVARARVNLDEHAASGKKDGFFYASALTKLFEHIAQIVDAHEPLVERHYGPGMMTKVVERLQMEADVQGGIVLDSWGEFRIIDRRLTDIKSYAFSFLVQSFLPPQKSMSTPRSGSPATRDGPSRNSEDEGVDMKEVNTILSETAIMLGRWALYCRFIASKTAIPVEPATPGRSEPPALVLPQFIANCSLQKKIATNLIEPFNTMTTFFFRRSVEKAFQLDEMPTLSLNPQKPLDATPPFVTSAVDDVMYILNQVLQRSLATSQRAVVASVVPTVGRILGSDFVGMIQRKMRDEVYPKAAIQGALPPEDKIIAFLVLINNLDIATDYLNRIVTSHINDNPESNDPSAPEKPNLSDLYPFSHDATFVKTTLQNLSSSFSAKTTELMGDGISVTFHQVIKPRIRPILSEAFKDIDYQPSSSTGADDTDSSASDTDHHHHSTNHNSSADPPSSSSSSSAQANLVRHRFDRGWSALTRPIKRLLTPAAFDKLLATTLAYLAKALEKRIWGYYGRVNELGAVRLERDVTGVVAAAVAVGARYGLREVFARCVQLTVVMNMEEDEWEEVGGAGAGEEGDWVLDKGERQRARAIVERGS